MKKLILIICFIFTTLLTFSVAAKGDLDEIKPGTLIKIFSTSGYKNAEFVYSGNVDTFYDRVLSSQDINDTGVFILKYLDTRGRRRIKLIRFTDGINGMSADSLIDTIAPLITITDGPTNDIEFFIPFEITFYVDENFGYFSKDDGLSYEQFYMGVTSFMISNSTTIKYYAMDIAGNSTITNSIEVTPDLTSPIITRTDGGSTNDYQISVPEDVTFSVDESYGYVSTNSGLSYQQFEIGEFSFTVSSTTTIFYYAMDVAGNSTMTNSFTLDLTP